MNISGYRGNFVSSSYLSEEASFGWDAMSSTAIGSGTRITTKFTLPNAP
jgi:hypothetical protein